MFCRISAVQLIAGFLIRVIVLFTITELTIPGQNSLVVASGLPPNSEAGSSGAGPLGKPNKKAGDIEAQKIPSVKGILQHKLTMTIRKIFTKVSESKSRCSKL